MNDIFDLQAWVTLARAQLNFGEPDKAIESFDKALAIKVPILFARQPSSMQSTMRASWAIIIYSSLLDLFVGLYAQPDYAEAKADRETAARLVKKRGQLHSSGGLSANKRRFTVGENSEKKESREEEAGR